MRYRERTSDEEVRIPILPTLKAYGMDDVPEGRGRTPVRCPFHGDRSPSATVDVDLQIFVCHTGSCAIKGNAPRAGNRDPVFRF